jgi:hypothetical protein
MMNMHAGADGRKVWPVSQNRMGKITYDRTIVPVYRLNLHSPVLSSLRKNGLRWKAGIRIRSPHIHPIISQIYTGKARPAGSQEKEVTK